MAASPVNWGADTMCLAVPDAPETFRVGSLKPDVVFKVDTPRAIDIQGQRKPMLAISDLSIRVPPRPPDGIEPAENQDAAVTTSPSATTATSVSRNAGVEEGGSAHAPSTDSSDANITEVFEWWPISACTEEGFENLHFTKTVHTPVDPPYRVLQPLSQLPPLPYTASDAPR